MPAISKIENILELGLGDDLCSECQLCGNNHATASCHLLTNVQHIADNVVLSRAQLTIPNELELQKMADGSYNVVAKVPLSIGTRFGPFEAKIKRVIPPVSFPIKVFKQNEDDDEYYLDPSNNNISNWMCFVDTASDYTEQNLICYQVKRQIYYSAIKDIKKGEGLRVWYAPFYAKKIGVSTLDRSERIKGKIGTQDIEKDQVQKVAESLPPKSLGAIDKDAKIWTCKFCKININNIVKFAAHLVEHYKKVAASISICSICNKKFKSEQILRHHILKIHNIKNSNEIKPKKLETITDLNVSATHSVDNAIDFPTNCFENSNCNPTLSLSPTRVGFEFTAKNHVNDALVGGQQQDQLENNSLLDNIVLGSLNYTQEIINTSMFSRISEINDHIRFDMKDSSDLTDSLNPDTLHDILCVDDSKANKIAQEKSIADFSLDFVENADLSMTTDTNSDQMIGADITSDTNPSSGPPYICDICQKEFQTVFYILRHLKKHSGEFTCLNCFVVFGRKENLLSHFCDWNGEVPEVLECAQCNKAFGSGKYLNRHVKKHQLQKSCTICGKFYKDNDEEKNHVCDDAAIKKKTKSSDQRRRERRIQKDEHSSHICYICGTQFPRAYLLRTHIKQHSEANYKCDVCSKVFYRLEFFRQHQKSHQNPRIECVVCHKMFKYSKSLYLHMRLHSDNPDITCDVCHKSFTQKCNLQKHQKKCHAQNENYMNQTPSATKRIDIGQIQNKSFSCSFCHKKFTEKSALSTHQEEHHRGETFSCPYCWTRFKHRNSIKRHLLKVHGDRIDEWDNAGFISRTRNQKNPTDTTLSTNDQMKPTTITSELTEDVMPDQVVEENNFLSELLPQVDSAELFNEDQMDFPNIVYLRDSHDVGLDMDISMKNTQFPNLEAMPDTFSNDHEVAYGPHKTSHADRPPDFETMDINSLMNSDDELINFPNVLNSTENLHEGLTDIIATNNVNESENNAPNAESIIQLGENESEITLGKDAYILEDGTIVAPQDTGNIVLYVLCS